MKALIPAAGIGTRLRPHTWNKPKALLPVAGRPILGHIIDDLLAAGIDACVLVVGYQGDAVRRWCAETYPDLDVTFVEQRERLGLGHALWTARDAVGDEPFFCILGDTILKADYPALLAAPGNCIAVREVDDPRRFGVVAMAGDRVVRFVEKPADPPSNLAIVGAYLLRDAAALWAALDRIVAEDRRTRGEYQLTDALESMLQEGCDFTIMRVSGWYDCGKRETWLETNRALLDAGDGTGEGPGVTAPCHLARGVVLEESRVGPHVSLGPGAVVRRSRLRDCIVGAGAVVEDCDLAGSVVGADCRLRGVTGMVDVGDDSEVAGPPRPAGDTNDGK